MFCCGRDGTASLDPDVPGTDLVPHRVERFFTDNYDHPIIEDGIQLVDMVYLKRERDMA